MADSGKAGDALGERRYKSGILYESRSEIEKLDRIAALRVDTEAAVSKPVCNHRFCRRTGG